MFGLVDQDYTLPDDVIESIGVKVFDYEKFEPKTFQPKQFEIQEFNVKSFKVPEFGIKVLRRGVIGVNQIGYV